jgi:hypothetical protein
VQHCPASQKLNQKERASDFENGLGTVRTKEVKIVIMVNNNNGLYALNVNAVDTGSENDIFIHLSEIQQLF